MCTVPVILRACRGEVDNKISSLQFIGHITEVIPQRDLALTRSPPVNDGVGVKIKSPFTQLLEMAIKTKPCMTGGKGGNKDCDGSPQMK